MTLWPDLVLVDTKMKQADGMDVCRRVLGADEQINVAVLTYYLAPDERRQACEAGVEGYLLKIVIPTACLTGLGSLLNANPHESWKWQSYC